MSIPLASLLISRYVRRGCNSSIVKSAYPATWCHIKYFATHKNDVNKELVQRDVFQNIKNKNKDTYLEMLNIYKEKEIKRRGHVEFIYSALKHMKEFGVEKDLDVYKSLIDVLPKGKMIPRNMFQAEFMHYPKQQQCAIDLLEQMEENGKCMSTLRKHFGVMLFINRMLNRLDRLARPSIISCNLLSLRPFSDFRKGKFA